MNPTLAKHAERTLITGAISLAANAGSSVILNIPVPINQMAHVRATVRGSAGALKIVPVTADAGTDVLTAGSAHGIVTGTPVMIAGTAVPGGTSATTIYYANAASGTTLKLYDTQANAVTGSGTGLTNLTDAGTAVQIRTVALNAVYIVRATAKNQYDKVALVGSVSTTDMEEIAAWAATAAANDTSNLLEIKATPDAVLATRFYVDAEVEYSSIV